MKEKLKEDLALNLKEERLRVRKKEKLVEELEAAKKTRLAAKLASDTDRATTEKLVLSLKVLEYKLAKSDKKLLEAADVLERTSEEIRRLKSKEHLCSFLRTYLESEAFVCQTDFIFWAGFDFCLKVFKLAVPKGFLLRCAHLFGFLSEDLVMVVVEDEAAEAVRAEMTKGLLSIDDEDGEE